jgi:hypothetical protein
VERIARLESIVRHWKCDNRRRGRVDMVSRGLFSLGYDHPTIQMPHERVVRGSTPQFKSGIGPLYPSQRNGHKKRGLKDLAKNQHGVDFPGYPFERQIQWGKL